MGSYLELEKKLGTLSGEVETLDLTGVVDELSAFEEAAVAVHANTLLSEKKRIHVVKRFAEKTYITLHDSIRAMAPEQVDNLASLLDKKNHDYGNSFDKLVDKYGDVAMSIRVSDKLSRVKQLARGEKATVKESIEDSLTDTLGYLLLIVNYAEKE